MSSVAAITRGILDRCFELGFARAGVCSAAPTEYADELKAWLAAGKQGEMQYLSKHVEILLDPQKLLPGATSIICVADRYAGHAGAPGSTRTLGAPVDPTEQVVGPRGRVARYALGDDYHIVIRERLERLRDALAREHPPHNFRVCVDTAPLLEREYAQRAGLGSIGKHTLIIEPGIGSWLLLGEIITTMPLEFSEPCEPDVCGTCTRCIDACPTQAITPWSVDAARCISYLTIEHRSPIDPTFHEAMGTWSFGCDICQEVCPHNQPTRRTVAAHRHEAYNAREALAPAGGGGAGLTLLDVLNWNEGDRRRVVDRSALERARLTMMKRNALIAAGNALQRSAHPGLRARIEAIARDSIEDELVRTTAQHVLCGLHAQP